MTIKNKAQRQRRQARRRERRKRKRQEQREKRQRWRTAEAVQAKEKPKPAPRASGHLMTKFWNYFRFDGVLEGFQQIKYKGLPLATLFLVLMLFGVLNATSDADLCEKVKTDTLLIEMCGVELLDKQQLYRVRKRLKAEEYDEWLAHLLRELQKDPRTASRSDGVVAGDDTVMLKQGQKMPNITLIYKASAGQYGLGYAMPSTHYADADKDYPLFCKLHRRTAEQQQAAKDKRLRRRKGLDRRRPEDEKAWMSELVAAGRKPEVAVLRGSRLSPGLTQHCARLNLVWLGVSPSNRKYHWKQKEAQSAKTLLKQEPKRQNWQVLNDEGVRVAWLGPAQSATLGCVTLLLAEKMDDGERTLYVAAEETDQATANVLVKAMLNAEQPAPDNSKLHDMLDLLKQARDFIQAETATFDRWFHVPWFIRSVLEEVGFKRVVIKAKTDRSYSAHDQTKNWQAWQAEVKTYRRHTVLGQAVNLARLKVQDPDLGSVQLVFVQEIRKRRLNGKWVEKIGQCYALMCTDSSWKPAKVFQAHKLRWKIEEFYREARQNHGLTRFHSRNEVSIHCHLVFAFISYICVALARLWNVRLKSKTLGWIKRHLFHAIVELIRQGEHLFVGFAPDWIDHYGLPDFC